MKDIAAQIYDKADNRRQSLMQISDEVKGQRNKKSGLTAFLIRDGSTLAWQLVSNHCSESICRRNLKRGASTP
jgi:hypothetical protein